MTSTIRVAILILAVIAASLALVTWMKSPIPLAFATVAAGLITFFHLLAKQPEARSTTDSQDNRLRAAIASALVVQYLVLVGIVSYFANGDAFGKLLPITETMLASFTATIGVVIAFYFGASAYVEGKRIEHASSASKPKETKASID